jgi:hypothetical protein
MKIEVLRYPADLKDPPYSHLLPVLHALIEHGNTTVDPNGFYWTRDGWRCDLSKPIDFELLSRTFEFPPTIILAEELDHVFCKNTWAEIAGSLNKDRWPPR